MAEQNEREEKMSIRDITTAVWNADTGDHLAAREMIRDDNGCFTLAKITTATGHILVAEAGEDVEGAYITYSIYCPGDLDMADGPITTDGFEITGEDHAAARLTDILAGY